MMKKCSKPMEYPSIRIYEEVVRRIFLNNLGLLMGLLITGQIALAEPILQPVFLVFENNDALFEQAERLETLGVRIRQRVPPQVLIADIPSTLNPSTIPQLKTFYTSAISISSLELVGPMGKAAGLQWNRQFVTESKKLGANSFGAMRVLVAQRSFSMIKNLKAKLEGNHINVSWDPLDAAMYYEMESAFDLSFSDRFLVTKTNLTELKIAAPMSGFSRTIYIRVRPIDHAESDHRFEDDIFGSWSGSEAVTINPLSEDKSGTIPSLSSPLNNFKTEGFTLILEWNENGMTQVQLSRSTSFQDTVIDEVVSGNEYVVPSQPLHVGDTLYWRVRNWGEKTSEWSEKRQVRIGAPRHTQTDMFIDPEMAK